MRTSRERQAGEGAADGRATAAGGRSRASTATAASGDPSSAWMQRWLGRLRRPSSHGRSPPGCRSWCSSPCDHTGPSVASFGVGAQTAGVPTGCGARCWLLCGTLPCVTASSWWNGNPAWTRQACPHCSHLGERFSPGGRGYPSRLRCGHCGWTGEANIVAALNLTRKWDRSFRDPSAAEKRAVAPSRRRKAGAAASREGSLETVGANVRRAPDAPAAGCRSGHPRQGRVCGAAGCWSRVRAQAACRERRGTTPQWPADPTRAHGGGSWPARREGTGGNRRKPDGGGTNDGGRGLSGQSGSS